LAGSSGSSRISRIAALGIVAVLASFFLVSAPAARADSASPPPPPTDDPAHRGPGFDHHQGAFGESDVNVCSTAVDLGTAHCNARVRTDPAADAQGAKASASPSVSPKVSAPGAGAYGPADLQAAYGTSSGGSSGRLVAIVDAYDDPNAEADLAAYRTAFNLPPCTSASGCFRKVDQNGGKAYPVSNRGWATEIALDLQMVSAVCPNCNILLVEAKSNSFNDLGTAVNRAVTMGAVAVSNSYGGSEFSGETAYGAAYFNHPGVAITVSSGDSGYGVEYPAASQYVTAVGGTTMQQTPDGSFTERAWSGAGSGCSAYEPKPAWQQNSGCDRRSVADVSAVADPATGVWVYDTFGGKGWAVYGGTSVASPIVGAVYALAGAATPADYPSSYPYANPAALHDVVSGSNGSCGGGYLCTALAGYDGPTGLGTPNGVAAFGPSAPAAPVPDFTIGATPSSLTVVKGANGSSALALTPLNGFSGSVSLTASVSPAGGGLTITNLTSQVPVSDTSPGAATLDVVANTPGNYTVTVTATSGTTVHQAAVTVTVPVPDFAVTASPATQGVTRGGSATYTVTVTPTNGFSGVVNLSVSGLQPNDSVSWSSNPVTIPTTGGAKTATLTIKTSNRDNRQTRNVTITGTSGSLSRSTKVTLTYR
jgi:hypothetical protein